MICRSLEVRAADSLCGTEYLRSVSALDVADASFARHTSIRIPLPPPKEGAHVRLDALRNAVREDDAAGRALAARRAERPPLRAPRSVHDEPALLLAQREVARFLEHRGERAAVARERSERHRLPRRARREVQRLRVALALDLRLTAVSGRVPNKQAHGAPASTRRDT